MKVKRPRPMPSPPQWFRRDCPAPPLPSITEEFGAPQPLMGDMQSDMARAQAVNTGATAANNHGNADVVYGEDNDRYGADLALWNQRGANMSQADHDACWNAIATAYANLQTQHDNLQLSAEHCGAGQGFVAAGDALADPNKTPKYVDAKNQYQASITCTGYCGPAHTNFAGQENAADAIKVKYG